MRTLFHPASAIDEAAVAQIWKILDHIGLDVRATAHIPGTRATAVPGVRCADAGGGANQAGLWELPAQPAPTLILISASTGD